jgi:predicted DNA binding CopG/RHH family protein
MIKGKKLRLDAYERDILRSVEAGEWRTSKDSKTRIKRFQRMAKAMIEKNHRVNVRLSSLDLQGLQQRALREGIPYQTLMSSVIHKYVTGILVEKTS